MAESTTAAGRHEGHDEHDPERIAALLDRDLPDADRAFAQARVAACPACAALHADLTALAKANLELPTPARLRDFRLTSDVAATLVQGMAGEPVPVGARLTGEMTDSRSRHAAHDRLLIANLVDRSVSDSERARAEEQLAACSDCALLYEDLVALSAATRSLLVPSRPRDFTLTPADADRLRRGWRRVLAAIGSSRDVFSRPLAVGLTTLGLAGLLVATIPAALTGQTGSQERLSTIGNAVGDASGGAGADPETMPSQAAPAPSSQAESGPAAAAVPSPGASAMAEPAPLTSADSGYERQAPDALFQGGESSPLAGEPDGRTADLYGKSLSAGQPIGGLAMIVVAGLLLLVGLGLFALRWIARRLGDG
ncbi:MAG: hypothetical protein Q7S35_01690 [Candidatus Limnocylindrales bacterium]|nr:hypothetical protein [Candidatus Limnocylindrales bacterium]